MLNHEVLSLLWVCMPVHPSLFAEKLRRWRFDNGTHGRVTQEALAALLDVSVDAIGKYERSLSFIRGDLESRLSERLGWSIDEVLACRLDWEARQGNFVDSKYQLLDDALVARHFDGSYRKAICHMISTADTELGRLPDELAVDKRVFLPIYQTYGDHWQMVIRDGRMVAKWALLFLFPEDEAEFRACRLRESNLSVERVRQPILPSTYFGYCPALIVGRGHESAAPLLLSSFVTYLEQLARRDIVLHGLGSISCSPGGAQVCQDLGMTRLGDYWLGPDYGVWELPGSAVSASLFGRRSPMLRQAYTQAFPR